MHLTYYYIGHYFRCIINFIDLIDYLLFIYIYVLFILNCLIGRKAVKLAKDDIKQLYSCLLTFIDIPKEFHAKSVMDEIILKLTNVKNSQVDQVLGKYYLKHEKV